MALMQFTDAVLKDLQFPDTQKIMKAVVIIKAPLAAENAKLIKCGHLYRPNNDPVDGVGAYSPDVKLSDIEFQLPSGSVDGQFDTYRPELIRGFQVAPKDDLHLTVQFRAHITGVERGYELLATRAKYLGKKIECSIRSLQEDFNFSGDPGGTRSGGDEDDDHEPEIDDRQMTLSEAETADASEVRNENCPHCQREVPKNADGFHTLDGELRECIADVPVQASNAEEKPEVTRGPALVDMSQMGIRRQRRQRTRAEMNQPSPEEIQAEVTVQ